jgi:4-amino-4-deoxy-L-arabinose transferase-like glycosyltransferase
MRTNAAAHEWRSSLAWSAVFRAAGLSIFGFIVWLWLFSADGPAWRTVSLVALLALAALVGVAWYLPRARVERRWRAALNHYGEQQLAKRRDLSQGRALSSRASVRRRPVETV